MKKVPPSASLDDLLKELKRIGRENRRLLKENGRLIREMLGDREKKLARARNRAQKRKEG